MFPQWTTSTYDGNGRLVSRTQFTASRPHRSGCAGIVGVFMIALFILWPVDLVGKTAAGTAVAVIWWVVLAGILVWAVAYAVHKGAVHRLTTAHIPQAGINPAPGPPPRQKDLREVAVEKRLVTRPESPAKYSNRR